jgi:hypothetical protein
MAEVTIELLGNPSKSKKGGPCWIGLATGPDSGLTFANEELQTVEVDEGELVTVVGKAQLKKQRGGIDKNGTKESLKVTGDKEDSVIVSVGSHMGVRAEITGVERVGQ